MNASQLLSAGIFFCGLNASADCNLKLAQNAGQYLQELEKAELRKYQNNSVCEVLSYEFWNCSKKQVAVLNKSFNVREVLGNYCMPHLPPPQPNTITSDQMMKGLELYSWKDHSGYYWYALLPGTNRNKKTSELILHKVSEGYLKSNLTNLPAGTQISWNNLITVEDKNQLEFSLPPKNIVSELKKSATHSKVTIE